MTDRDDPAPPRLRADIFVSAYLRRCQGGGAFAALSRRGDASAGAVFIEVLHRNGADLYGPAPGRGGRVFERVLEGVPGFEVAERMASEARFDADLWLITVEDVAGRHFLSDDEYV